MQYSTIEFFNTIGQLLNINFVLSIYFVLTLNTVILNISELLVIFLRGREIAKIIKYCSILLRKNKYGHG